MLNVLVIVFVLCGVHAGTPKQIAQSEFKQVTVTEGKDVNLECPGTKVLHIADSLYGKKTENCGKNKSSLKIVEERCEGKNKCLAFIASNDEFGDPCPGIIKSLWVNYTCVDLNGSVDNLRESETICENDEREIKCPGTGLIHVEYAFYGRNDQKTCFKPMTVMNTRCTTENALEIVKSRCQNKSSCILKSKNEVFKDPCPYTYKYLIVDYKCIISQTEKTLLRNSSELADTIKMSCPKGSIIENKNEFYVAVEEYIFEVSSWCDDKETCQFRVPPELLTAKELTIKYDCVLVLKTPRDKEVKENNPDINLSCPQGTSIVVDDAMYSSPSYIFRYFAGFTQAKDIITGSCLRQSNCKMFLVWLSNILHVQYYCLKDTSSHSLACEDSTLEIDCPSQAKVNILSATYGRSHPYVCNTKVEQMYPRGCANLSTNVTSAVYNICQGKSYCIMRASNYVFGDPCVGVKKYLEVKHECVV